MNAAVNANDKIAASSPLSRTFFIGDIIPNTVKEGQKLYTPIIYGHDNKNSGARRNRLTPVGQPR